MSAVKISELILNYMNMLDINRNSLQELINSKGGKITPTAIAKWINGTVNSIQLKNALILADVFYLVGEKRKEFLTTVTGFDLQSVVKTVLIIHENGKRENTISSAITEKFTKLGYQTKHCFPSNIAEEIASANFVICLISPLAFCNIEQNNDWTCYLSSLIEQGFISLTLSVDLNAEQFARIRQWSYLVTVLSWGQNDTNMMKLILDELIKKEITTPYTDHINPPILVTPDTVSEHSKISTKRKALIEKLLQYFSVNRNPTPLVLLSQFDTIPIRSLIIDIAKKQYTPIYDIVLPQYTDDASFYNNLARQFNLLNISSAGQFEQQLNEKLSHANQPHLCLISRFEKIACDGISKQFAGILRSLNEKVGSHFHIILLGGKKLQELTLPSDISSMLNNAWIEYWPEWTYDELNLIYKDVPELPIAETLMKISGGHPQLLETCLLLYKSEPAINSIRLSNSLFLHEKFVRLITNKDEQEKLIVLIDKAVLKTVVSPIWMHTNPLLKKLYWENLITQREEGLCWRCEAIQLAGKQVLENIAL